MFTSHKMLKQNFIFYIVILRSNMKFFHIILNVAFSFFLLGSLFYMILVSIVCFQSQKKTLLNKTPIR